MTVDESSCLSGNHHDPKSGNPDPESGNPAPESGNPDPESGNLDFTPRNPDPISGSPDFTSGFMMISHQTLGVKRCGMRSKGPGKVII